MNKTLFLLMLITFISQFFGLLKDVILAYYYGASAITDIFLLSLTVSTVLFSLVGIGISTSFIPYFRKVEKEYGTLESSKFTGTIFNLLNVVVTIIIIVGLIFTEPLVKVFALGFDEAMLEQTVLFTRISLLGGYSTILILLFNAFLRLHEQFLTPAINTIIPHIFLIIFIYLSTLFNVLYIVIGVVLGLLVQCLILLYFSFKKGFRFNKGMFYKENVTRNMIYNSVPIMLSDLFRQLNVIVDKTLASQIAIGGISSLNYASKINGFVQGIFVLSIANIMYPRISKLVAESKTEELKSAVSNSIILIVFFVMPATIGSMVLAEPLVEFLFGRGAFTSTDVSMTANVLFYYSIGMIGFSLREIVLRIFYSYKDTKTPMMNTLVTVFLNIFFSIALSKVMGIAGLALATSITGILSFIFLFYKLNIHVGTMNIKKMISSLIKIIISSLLMGFVVNLIFTNLGFIFDSNISVIFSILFGVLFYAILIILFRLKEAQIIMNIFFKKNKKTN